MFFIRWSSLSLLLMSTPLLVSEGYTMNPSHQVADSQDRPSSSRAPRLDVISPEMAGIQQQLTQHNQRYPHLAEGRPTIRTREDFENAKAYLSLMEQYAVGLRGIILASLANPIAIDYSLRCEQALIPYIVTLRGDSCLAFRSQEDDDLLAKAFYESHFRLGAIRLMEFMLPLEKNPLDQNTRKIADEIFKIQSILSQSSDPHYLHDFQKYIRLHSAVLFSQLETRHPHILTHPFIQENPALRESFIEEKKELNHVLRSIPTTKLESLKESYDLYFSAKTYTILLTFNDILKDSPPNAPKLFKDNLQDYLELEREGLRFKAKLIPQKESEEETTLSTETLTEFYDFMTERLKNLPQKDPVGLLPNIIVALVAADKKPEALKRLDVLEHLLLKKGALSPHFIQFRAKIKAMCSNFEEINRLYARQISGSSERLPSSPPLALDAAPPIKKNKNQRKRANKQRRGKEAKASSAALLEQRPLSPPEGSVESDAEEATNTQELPLSPPIEARLTPEKEAKHERHLAAEHLREVARLSTVATGKQEAPYLAADLPTEMPVKTAALPLVFSFSSKSYDVLNKLFADDWKISRKDIETFFEEISQDVDKTTGSSHHIIRISQGIAILKEGKTLGVISDLSADMEGHISLPTWTKIVPHYTRKDVLTLIGLMGITKGNYTKGRSVVYKALQKS